VTADARFALRTDAGRVDLQRRRDARRITFEASPVTATLVARLHDVDPATVAADGQPLPRLEPSRLERADRGWTVDGRTTVLKARANTLRIE
jgi:hypothetical protein